MIIWERLEYSLGSPNRKEIFFYIKISITKYERMKNFCGFLHHFGFKNEFHFCGHKSGVDLYMSNNFVKLKYKYNSKEENKTLCFKNE